MKIYHNPRCSKSRKSLTLIQETGLDVDVIEYLKTPPTVAELTAVISLLGVPAESIVRKKEALFQELGLSQQTLSEQQWIETLCEHPKLIERPIVVSGKQAVIGRPPERIEPLLQR